MPPVKRRYILFQVDPLDLTDSKSFNIRESEIVNAVRDIVKKIHGDFGLGSIINFYVKKFDNTTRTGVIVVKRTSYQFITTSLPLLQVIGGKQVRINILKITGTLRGGFRALQGFHGKMIHQYKQKIRSKEFRHIESSQQITDGFKSIAESLEESRK